MKSRNKKRMFLWLLVVVIAAVIFLFSAMSGAESMTMSKGLTYWFVRLIYQDYDHLSLERQEEIYRLFVFIVRKTAHFTEFTAFGAALMLLIKDYHIAREKRWAWAIGSFYAATDELHQYFVGTRTPSIKDVGIDVMGVGMGILIVSLIFFCIERRRCKKEGNK